MKKAELIRSIAASTGVQATTVRTVVDGMSDAALAAIAKGDEVFLAGLGKLVISRRGPKAARNIHTGEKLTVPARNVVVYRPSVAALNAANAA